MRNRHNVVLPWTHSTQAATRDRCYKRQLACSICKRVLFVDQTQELPARVCFRGLGGRCFGEYYDSIVLPGLIFRKRFIMNGSKTSNCFRIFCGSWRIRKRREEVPLISASDSKPVALRLGSVVSRPIPDPVLPRGYCLLAGIPPMFQLSARLKAAFFWARRLCHWRQGHFLWHFKS